MTFSDYRETYSWQAAIALGSKIIQLAEQLPASEQTGLGLQLREAMVALPTSIARDLINGGRSRFDGALQLSSVVELIEHIYPALDTAEVREPLETLMTRLAGDTFDERVAAKTPPAPAPEAIELPHAPAAAEHHDEAVPAPAPATVTLTPTVTPAPEASVTPVTLPQPQAADVHPDSV